MRITSILTTLGLAGILAGSARANPKLQLEVLAETPRNQAIVKTVGLAEIPGGVNLFGFVNYVGNSSDGFYSEASAGRKIYKSFGAKLEWNGGTGFDDIFRLGPEYTLNPGNKLFLDLKFYPLAVNTKGKVEPESQVSTFARLDLPKGFYVENWTDINFNYKGNQPAVASETTVGKKIVGNLAFEAQHAHNVNILGEQARVGLRYNF